MWALLMVCLLAVGPVLPLEKCTTNFARHIL
jgi:hypothetical protein